MHPFRITAGFFFTTFIVFAADGPKLPGVGKAMERMVENKEIAGAVTMVVGRDGILHSETTGFADVESRRPMSPDTVFWIASMTKPITAVAIMMLQDEGKLKASDPVSKYLPEFANLQTPSGKPANLTITQILTHTSGLGEVPREEAKKARTLKDLGPLWVAAKMQFEPGAKWSYCQSGINAAGRIVEVVSGMSFDEFLQQRLFDPLGMKDTTFYPSDEQGKRLVTAYEKKEGALSAVPPRDDFGSKDRPPQGNGGLFSTAPDYARFCQMLLNGGSFEGKRYVSEEALKFINTPQTGDMPVGFFQNDTWGNRGKNYGWGLGTCVLKEPHEGVAEVLSPGTYGHGGAWGTQAWIDPVKGVAYVLMVQRSNFPNSDGSEVRREFQKAANAALQKKAAGNQGGNSVFEIRAVSKTAGEEFVPMVHILPGGGKETLYVAKKPAITASSIKSTSVHKDRINERSVISVEFTETASKQFADLTAANIDQRLAIMVNGKVITAPVIRTKITGGKAEISGNFNEEEAHKMAREIQAAARQ
ncbi:MAG: serine hydrolase [Limisphaerales bacterium]